MPLTRSEKTIAYFAHVLVARVLLDNLVETHVRRRSILDIFVLLAQYQEDLASPEPRTQLECLLLTATCERSLETLLLASCATRTEYVERVKEVRCIMLALEAANDYFGEFDDFVTAFTFNSYGGE